MRENRPFHMMSELPTLHSHSSALDFFSLRNSRSQASPSQACELLITHYHQKRFCTGNAGAWDLAANPILSHELFILHQGTTAVTSLFSSTRGILRVQAVLPVELGHKLPNPRCLHGTRAANVGRRRNQRRFPKNSFYAGIFTSRCGTR